MKVSIYSRKAMEALLSRGKIENTAIISFHDPVGRGRRHLEDYEPIDFTGKCDRVMQIAIHDLDPEALSDFGLSVETYFPEGDELAEFIYKAKDDGLDIICQCEYGQSRSAGCAAAILEHFEHRGIDIFSDYKYYPNQLVYHKIYDALNKHLKESVDGELSAIDPNKEYTFEDVLAMFPAEMEKTCIIDKFLSALEFVKTTEDFKIVDMQRYLKCGYGDTGRILDALLLLGIITKIENTPVKFKVVLKGENSAGSRNKKDID